MSSRAATPRTHIDKNPSRSPSVEHNRTPERSTSRQDTLSLSDDYSTPKRPAFFHEFSHFWFYLKHEHTIEGLKVWLNNELKNFIRHPSKSDAIRIIEETTLNVPYMTAYQAFQTLVSFFGADKVTSDGFGPKNRSFIIQLD